MKPIEVICIFGLAIICIWQTIERSNLQKKLESPQCIIMQHDVKDMFFAYVLKKDTIPGGYKYTVYGEEDGLKNTETLTTTNNYAVNSYVITDIKLLKDDL